MAANASQTHATPQQTRKGSNDSDVSGNSIFINVEYFDINTAEGRVTYCHILFFLLMIISCIIGITSYSSQINIWRGYSDEYGDDEKINEVCQDKYEELSEIARDKYGNELDIKGTDAASDMRSLLIINTVLLGYTALVFILNLMYFKYFPNLVEGGDAALIAGSVGGFLIIFVVHLYYSTRFVAVFFHSIEEYCDEER
eukprot:60877_1